MQDMIKRILDADNKARALEEQNIKNLNLQKDQIDRKAQETYQLRLEEAMKTVKKNDAYEELKADKQWRSFSARQQSAMIKLQSDFENNRERWVDEIVARVIESA